MQEVNSALSTKDYIPWSWMAIRQAMLNGQHYLQDKFVNWNFNVKILFKYIN